jgi:hypothetical protein
MRKLTLCIGLLLAALAVGSAWVHEGEVVTLTTWDAGDHPRRSRLWIVEVDGAPYLRADLPGASWLARLRARPQVEVQRNGERARYQAVPVDDPAVREAVARAMAAKYGLLDELLGAVVRDDGRAQPVRLDAVPDDTK